MAVQVNRRYRTAHDRFVGTPAFASPEQFAPKAFGTALDVRSDIYSLGETLWFALKIGRAHV